MNPTRRADYRDWTPIRSLIPAPPEFHPDPSPNHTFEGLVRERALWLTYLPILPQCGHEYWNSSWVRAGARVSR